MSADRFDEFTRALATGASRRKLLKAMVAAVAGGAATILFGPAGQADAYAHYPGCCKQREAAARKTCRQFGQTVAFFACDTTCNSGYSCG
jgi:hypothetical protein